jgi:RNA polymerase sigma-70 factor (ECF subfamily)
MAVPQTQLTLVARLRDPADAAAWERLERLYRDLLVHYAMREGLQAADAEDVAQGVFAALLRSMPQFRFDPARGRFRDYLFTATRAHLARQKRFSARLVAGQPVIPLDARTDGARQDALEPVAHDDEARERFEQEWINHHYRRAMDELRRTHPEESVVMFERLLRGEPVETVAADLGTTVEAIYKRRERIRERLREILDAQLAEEEG